MLTAQRTKRFILFTFLEILKHLKAEHATFHLTILYQEYTQGDGKTTGLKPFKIV